VTFFFGRQELERFVFSSEDSHHLVRVLRFRTGDTVWGIDGSGSAFEVRLEVADPRAAAGVVTAAHAEFNEPARRVVLIQGAIRPARMDWLVEKATELGVAEVWPIAGRPPVGPGRLRRWQRIARGAAKQCRRGRIPTVMGSRGLEEILGQLPERTCRLVAAPGGADRLPACAVERELILAVGPQRGFSEDERRRFAQLGFLPVSLGVRRLRAETAALCLLASAVRAAETGA
jgi:16S rRNA (uracil1498-N3)-methyltransferase